MIAVLRLGEWIKKRGRLLSTQYKPRATCRRRPWLWSAGCGLLLAVSASGAYAKAPDSVPQPLAEQKKPVVHRPLVPGRGQMLYENHCMSCHASVVHIRTRHSARSLAEIESWTRRWAGQLHLPWGAEEFDDVVRFLNTRYYHYAQP